MLFIREGTLICYRTLSFMLRSVAVEREREGERERERESGDLKIGE